MPPLNERQRRTVDIWGILVCSMRSRWGIDLVWAQLHCRSVPFLPEYRNLITSRRKCYLCKSRGGDSHRTRRPISRDRSSTRKGGLKGIASLGSNLTRVIATEQVTELS